MIKNIWQGHPTAGSTGNVDDVGIFTVNITNTADRYAPCSAAETGLTEAARKINASVPAAETPLAITETDYWKKKHHDIKQAYWKHKQVKGKSNCPACHLDAEAGTFEDAAMRLPKLK